MLYSTLLFDLDGTLTDPEPGITRSISYALEQLDAPPQEQAALRACIGPPLRQTFARLLATNDAELIERGVGLYRERFSTTGLYENRPYDGIAEVLGEIRSSGRRLFVATSKSIPFARRVLEHFSLIDYFDGVYGSELDGRFDDKGELITELLLRESVVPSAAAMIGDRREDIVAAKRNGVTAVGVLYGFGSIEELTGAGADMLLDAPSEIIATLLG
jgi:phosphoglycolate phosphatase